MKRLFGLLSLLVLAVVLACQSDPTGIASRPSGITPNFDLSCAGIPNGGVTLLNTVPRQDTIHYVYTPHSDTVSVQVWRDDPNTPGEQVYCRDYTTPVTWSKAAPPGYEPRFNLSNIHAQDVTITSTGIGPTYFTYLIATLSPKTDTTYVRNAF